MTMSTMGPMSRLPPVLTIADLPLAELHAIRLDGQLVMVDDGFAPIDQPPSPAQRAAAIALYCHERLIAEQRSAAWVWGASADPPRRHELCASIGARARSSVPGRLAVREVVISDDELVHLGGIRVTSPVRTVMDLARFQEPFDAQLVRALLAVTHLSLQACEAELRARHNLPLKKRALARLATVRSTG